MAKIGDIECKVYKGSITDNEVDTIVVPAPLTEAGLGGVFEAVNKAGAAKGTQFMQDWHHGSIDYLPPGGSMTVDAGDGKSHYLTHVGTIPDLVSGPTKSFGLVVLGVESALEEIMLKNAEHEKTQVVTTRKPLIKSVAIPMMSTGQIGFLDPGQSARAMLIGVDRFVKAHPDSGLEITFCAQSDAHVDVLHKIMADPNMYTGVPDENILMEKGAKRPDAYDAMPHVAKSSLLKPLARDLPRKPYAQAVTGRGGYMPGHG